MKMQSAYLHFKYFGCTFAVKFFSGVYHPQHTRDEKVTKNSLSVASVCPYVCLSVCVCLKDVCYHSNEFVCNRVFFEDYFADTVDRLSNHYYHYNYK